MGGIGSQFLESWRFFFFFFVILCCDVIRVGGLQEDLHLVLALLLHVPPLLNMVLSYFPKSSCCSVCYDYSIRSNPLLIFVFFSVNRAPPPAPAQATSGGGGMFSGIGSTIAQGKRVSFVLCLDQTCWF